MATNDRDEILHLVEEAKDELEALCIDEDWHDHAIELARLRKATELLVSATRMYASTCTP